MIKTVSLETAKVLKEAGFPQDDCLFNWGQRFNPITKKYDYAPDTFMDITEGKLKIIAAAPISDEIIEYLPDSIKLNDIFLFFRISKHQNKEYLVSYRGFADGNDHSEIGESLPEALAQMWLWLKKKGLLKPKEGKDE